MGQRNLGCGQKILKNKCISKFFLFHFFLWNHKYLIFCIKWLITCQMSLSYSLFCVVILKVWFLTAVQQKVSFYYIIWKKFWVSPQTTLKKHTQFTSNCDCKSPQFIKQSPTTVVHSKNLLLLIVNPVQFGCAPM